MDDLQALVEIPVAELPGLLRAERSVDQAMQWTNFMWKHNGLLHGVKKNDQGQWVAVLSYTDPEGHHQNRKEFLIGRTVGDFRYAMVPHLMPGQDQTAVFLT